MSAVLIRRSHQKFPVQNSDAMRNLNLFRRIRYISLIIPHLLANMGLKEPISTTCISPTKLDCSLLREKTKKPLTSSHHHKRPTTLPIKSYVNTVTVPSATSSADLPGEHPKLSGLMEENKRLRYRILQLEKRESQFTADLDKLQVIFQCTICHNPLKLKDLCR